MATLLFILAMTALIYLAPRPMPKRRSRRSAGDWKPLGL